MCVHMVYVCTYVRMYIHVHVFAFAYVCIPVCVQQKDVPKILEAYNINTDIDLFVQERAKRGNNCYVFINVECTQRDFSFYSNCT